MSAAAPAFDPQALVATLPQRPGVYRMYDAAGELIYVGKAASLRDRVGSYFSTRSQSPKVAAMLRRVARIEVTVVGSETDALLLECNLIKAHRPRYNIILRDDKTFPYILCASGHEFPRLQFWRGLRRPRGAAVRPVPERARGQGGAAAAAEGVPNPQLPRRVLRAPEPAVPAAPDRTLLGALRRPDQRRGLPP